MGVDVTKLEKGGRQFLDACKDAGIVFITDTVVNDFMKMTNEEWDAKYKEASNDG